LLGAIVYSTTIATAVAPSTGLVCTSPRLRSSFLPFDQSNMLWFLLLGAALAHPATLPKPSQKQRFVHNRLKASAPAAPLEVSKNIISLHKTDVSAASSQRLHVAVRANGAAHLIPTEGAVGYAVNVDFAGTTLQLILDTGSSDTWVASSSLTCLDQFGEEVPDAQCNFGPLYNGSFPEGNVTDENFSISYGDGEVVVGNLGYTDVSLGGIEVRHQEVAIAEEAFWQGDGQTSGLLGFAYPSITNAFEGDDPNEDGAATHIPYDPIVTTASKEDLFTSFSLAIERGSGGYMALGGLPPIDYGEGFVSTPIEIITLGNDSALSFYSITPNSYKLVSANASAAGAPQTIAADTQVIVDSGNLCTYETTACRADTEQFPRYHSYISLTISRSPGERRLLSTSSIPPAGRWLRSRLRRHAAHLRRHDQRHGLPCERPRPAADRRGGHGPEHRSMHYRRSDIFWWPGDPRRCLPAQCGCRLRRRCWRDAVRCA